MAGHDSSLIGNDGFYQNPFFHDNFSRNVVPSPTHGGIAIPSVHDIFNKLRKNVKENHDVA